MKKIAVIFMALALMLPFRSSFISVNAEDSDIIRNDESGIPDKNFYVVLTDEDNKNIEKKLTFACEQLTAMNFEKKQSEKSCKFCAFKQICNSLTV